jgi:5,10-methylene-tetrahydrofolate dehydrogenase/methenyl tetrahydrofolate cyclohydrolase
VGAHVIDGRGLTAQLKGRLAAELADCMEAAVVPGLATVLIGSPAEAKAYERRDPHTGKESFVGDLDFAGVATMPEALSPVPGGVGPITDVWHLKNTAARVSTRAEETRRSLEPAAAGKNGIAGAATVSS